MDNLRGSLLMTLAMLGFAVEDVLIKALSDRIPPGQIILSVGVGGAVVFALWFVLRGRPVLTRELVRPGIMARTGLEMLGTIFFVSSLALIPITTASAVIQATPLVVAMGGALFLAQPVGWRRWAAIVVGLAGVMMILRPGGATFDPAVLLAVAGMLALAARDIVTRGLDLSVSSAHLTFMAFLSLIPAGLILAAVTGTPLVTVSGMDLAWLGATVGVGLFAYVTIVGATRIGDVAVVSSFRYVRMVYALAFGFLVFGERSDAMTLGGAGIIIAAGLYALMREARASQPGPRTLYGRETPVSATNAKRTAP